MCRTLKIRSERSSPSTLFGFWLHLQHYSALYLDLTGSIEKLYTFTFTCMQRHPVLLLKKLYCVHGKRSIMEIDKKKKAQHLKNQSVCVLFVMLF